MRVYVPSDSTALSQGADDIARALAKLNLDIEIVRNGSRGLCWLEPLLEIDSPEGRLGFANVTAGEVEALFSQGVPSHSHSRCLGLIEELPYLKQQLRLTSSRIGLTEPCSLDDYRAHGGFSGLANAKKMSAEEIVAAVTQSGLRGRGGAAFPTGIKWQTVLDAPGDKKYITCNADEGDSGTFVDRLIMESDPLVVIEGMIIDTRLGVPFAQLITSLDEAVALLPAVRDQELATNVRASLQNLRNYLLHPDDILLGGLRRDPFLSDIVVALQTRPVR